jgi:hypothetical protein
MSTQFIPLKDRTDLRESSRILALETIAFELQRRGYAARGRVLPGSSASFCTDVGHHAASPRRHELAAISFDQKMIRRR